MNRIQAAIQGVLSDERLVANLIALHVVVGVILFVVILVRKLLKHGGDSVSRLTGLSWIEGASREAISSIRSMLSWIAMGGVLGAIAFIIVYHQQGRDIRIDGRRVYEHFAPEQLYAFGTLLGKIVLVVLGVGIGFRILHRVRRYLQDQAFRYLPRKTHDEGPALALDADPVETPQESSHEIAIRRWFDLFERFGMVMLTLGGFWIGGRMFGFSQTDSIARLIFEVLVILAVARLLILSTGWISAILRLIGNANLTRTPFRRYWERFTRLFPFGERCLEYAVAVQAASMILAKFNLNYIVAHDAAGNTSADLLLGDAIVRCIAIAFGARVVIELFNVFINEIFGTFDENKAVDQKNLTLVPLLQSFSQYVVFVGAGVYMLGMFMDTKPILASLGILGLAVGLGAQNFVTDVVSGFFILFENQYLVGDIVQLGDTTGRVEALNIRNTQIRDDQGKLCIIPNGQIKTVVNYSKGWVNAVVDIKVPTSMNLERVMQDMAEAGRRLRQARREVLGDTQVRGLVDLTPSDMVIRAITKVQPGAHAIIQQEYRRLLKEVFDQESHGKALAA